MPKKADPIAENTPVLRHDYVYNKLKTFNPELESWTDIILDPKGGDVYLFYTDEEIKKSES
jgi:hypothetical protein